LGAGSAHAAFSAASATPSATFGVKSSAAGGPSMGYVRPLSVTRRAAPRRGRRVADRAADLAVKKGFERVLLRRQTTNRCLPLWLGYNTVPVAGSARTAPAPPLPSLLLRLSLAFFWPSLIFALRSSRSLSRASLSSCAAKQNHHAFHFWVLAFKLFLGLNRATVLCVFVGSTVLLHNDAMAAISIFHPCRLRQTPCTMMTACSTA